MQIAFDITDDEMTKFAHALLREPSSDPFKAALELFPDQTNKALWVAHYLPKSEKFVELKHKILSSKGEAEFFRSEKDYVELLWSFATGEKWATKEMIEAAKTYGAVRGFVKKEPATQVNLVNKVMVVKDMGDDQNWEDKTAKQQDALINVSTSRH